MSLCIHNHVQVVNVRVTALQYIQEREYLWCDFQCEFFFSLSYIFSIISKCALTINKVENRTRPDKGPRERWFLRGWCRTGLVPHTLSHHTLPTSAETERERLANSLRERMRKKKKTEIFSSSILFEV